jgi:hypothetical protein
MAADKPQVFMGQLVLFTLQDGKTERPAIVVRVVEDNSIVNLQVFVDGTNDMDILAQSTSENILWQTSVPFSATPAKRTWRFPPVVQTPPVAGPPISP